MAGFLKKEEFGIPLYNPKAMVRDLIPVETHQYAKTKREFFTDQAIKDNKWCPGVGHNFNEKDTDWTKNPSFKYSKFRSAKRITIAGELEIKNARKETTSPGPAGYDHGNQKLKNMNKTAVGCYQLNEQRKDEQYRVRRLSLQEPGKYKDIEPVSLFLNYLTFVKTMYKETRNRITDFKGPKRFDKGPTDGPNCASYK